MFKSCQVYPDELENTFPAAMIHFIDMINSLNKVNSVLETRVLGPDMCRKFNSE